MRTLILLSTLLLLISCKKENLTDRGYGFVHHIANEGAKPQAGEYVYFDIVMRSGDSVLNSSTAMSTKDKPRIQVPQPDQLNANTPPVLDGLLRMSVGDSLTLAFPLDCLEVVPPFLQDVDVIHYDLTLLDIKSDEAYQEELQQLMAEKEAKRKAVAERAPEIEKMIAQTLADYKKGKLDISKTDSGLEYIIHEEGQGEKPNQGEYVGVQYYGVLENGKMFDNSFQDGEPFGFQIGLGRVIKGWDEGLAMLPKGSKATLFVPYELGYGEAGYQDIPERAKLIFYVELEP